MKFVAAIVGLTALGALCLSVTRAVEPVLDAKFSSLVGEVIIVGSEGETLRTSEDEPQDINVGGLMIVQVHDLGSAPVDIKDVEAPASLELIGKVRGVGVDDEGNRLMGGAYTWLMFRAGDKLGAATITVTYEPASHVGGDSHEEVHFLNIVENDE